MLVKAPPPLPFPLTATNRRWKWKDQLGHTSSNGSGSNNSRNRLVTVRAGYIRRPMETPGAYELIDDATGDKFIVWGGVDDQDQHSPVPPNHLLLSSNWDTSASPSPPGNRGAAAVTNNASAKAPTRGLPANFGRLKAQRVRALVGKTSRMKQEKTQNDVDEQVGEDTVLDQSVGSPSTLDFMRKKMIKDALPRSKPFRETMPPTRTLESLENYGASEKHGVERISVSQTTTDRTHNSDTRRDRPQVSYPKGSASNSRGWGNRGFTSNLKFDSESSVQHKRWHKQSSQSDFFSRKSFRELGYTEYMIESLERQHYLRPSNIQAMAFGPAIKGKSCVIADQSGSGKTLAYLVPVIQRLRQEELEGLSKSSSRCPRVVIMVPTAELASQVLSNCRSMSKFGVPFRSMVVTGGFRQRTQLENLQQGVDVLIATPGRFMFLIKEGFLELTNLICAVLDEVDILCNDEDFEVALQSLINSSPVTSQYLFVTATLPVDIYNKLVEVFPDCEVIMGPGMHRISPGLEEVLVDCSGEDGTERTPETAFLNKKTALLQLVEESPVSRTIIFCNKIETCRKVENALKRFDRKGTWLQVLPFHAAVAQESRLANMKEFTDSESEGETLFLVCTDRASRGIDFAGVDHVVLFDFPRDPSEYVRRVGRTARGAGGKGKAFIFVVGKQVPLARRIMERNQKGHPLHDVPSAYELMS